MNVHGRQLGAVRLVIVGAVVLAGLTVGPSSGKADNAPMWASPEGLAPGEPNSRVRMVAEEVNIQVLEQSDGVSADVTAVFDMFNPGTNAQMLVGFPSFASEALPPGSDPAYSPVMFQPTSLSNFRASSPLGRYTPTVRKVRTGQYSNTDWYVWTMTYPGNKPLRVEVAYRQLLLDLKMSGAGTRPPPWVPVSYVLRTGALWDGTIEKATVRMSGPPGGQLQPIKPDGQSADGQLTWTMTNFKPTEDIDAIYFRAASWDTLRTAEAAAAAPTATADDLVRSTTVVLKVFGADPAGEYGVLSLSGFRIYDPPFANRYFPLIGGWVKRAHDLDPNSAAAWELTGDLGQLGAVEKHGHLVCWPSAAADGYQRAADPGSGSAAQKLDGLTKQGEEDGAMTASYGEGLAECG